MALPLVKMPKPIRTVSGSGKAPLAPDSWPSDAEVARAAWLEAVRALARAAAQADHDAATRTTGRPIE
jgi:hypothetical protein